MNEGTGRAKHVFLVTILLIAAGYGIQAWAIDCTSAASKVDKVICSDRDLANQDAELNKNFSQAIKLLSPDGQSELGNDQHAWLRYRDLACGFAEEKNLDEDKRCLTGLIYSRIEAESIVLSQKIPSFNYFLRGFYKTSPDAWSDLPLRSESLIPQIDFKPSKTDMDPSDVKIWNAMIARLLGQLPNRSMCRGGRADVYSLARIASASALLISVNEDIEVTCREYSGQGPLINPLRNSFNFEKHINIVMMRGDVHLLQPQDLFMPGDEWKRRLTMRVEQEVYKQAAAHRRSSHLSADAIERIAIDPSNWAVGNSLSIRVKPLASLDDDEVEGFNVDISVRDLQDILSFKGRRILSSPSW